MFGAGTTTGVAESFWPPVGHRSSNLASDANHAPRDSIGSGGGGALATAEDAVSKFLRSAGFLDTTAPFAENFAACLHYDPPETEVKALDPGVLKELLALLKSKFAADPKQALAGQTRIRPERAIRLLQ